MNLTDLIPRIESGEGEDRELEAEIWLATTPGATRRKSTVTSSKGLWPPYVLDETRDATDALITVPAYTTSVDAVLALVEAKLPGWAVASLGQTDQKGWWAELRKGHITSYDVVAISDTRIRITSPARALLAAVCRAMEGG